jgi:hypothetical protein
MTSKEPLVIKTPIRKRLGGLWLGGACAGAFIVWSGGAKGSGSEILLIVAIILALMAFHRLLSSTVTTFLPGTTPRATRLNSHFGLFTSQEDVSFDELEILRRDNVLPYCQLYAYSSLEYMKKKVSKVEIEKYESGQQPLPGVIVVDHTTKKECDKHIQAIWRYYGLWEENPIALAAEKTD